MKRRFLVITVVLLSAVLLVDAEAWARARGGGGGGGSSAGSRGSRSYSAPTAPSSPTSPGRQMGQPARPAPATPAAAPSRGFFGGGLMSGIAGFALGGLIGSMLFGGMGHGMGGGFGGGFGLLEVLLIGGAIAMIVMMIRRRRAEQQQPAYAGASGASTAGYAPPTNGGNGQYTSSYGATAAPAALEDVSPATADLERGVGHIRQMDPTFDELQFTATATAVFMRVQGAWPTGNLEAVRDALAPEIAAEMQRECDQLLAQGRTNRVEQIDVNRAQVSEAWQENGQDYVTVLFSASMVDYVMDAGGNVVEGSRTTPNRVEEFWTFTRPVGPNRWKLSAIQQPA